MEQPSTPADTASPRPSARLHEADPTRMTRRRSSTHLMPSLFMAGLEAQQVETVRIWLIHSVLSTAVAWVHDVNPFSS